MCVSGWPVALLLFRLFGSVTSSPVSIYTPAPPLPSQISSPSPFPSKRPPLPSSLTTPHPPTFSGSSGKSAERAGCPLTMSPFTLVVKFEDPVTANCSAPEMVFSLLGWEVTLAAPTPTMERFLVWSVDRMTDWDIKPMCYALSDEQGQCHIDLPVIVYKPPDNVSLSIDAPSGPLFEGRQYTLQCEVQNVAPAQNLIVTFYKGQTVLGQLQSNNTGKKPVTEIFKLSIVPSKEDDEVQYWCEAKLVLGPDGPPHPPVVTSQKLSATVLFRPHLCPTKLQVREGESFACEVSGNPLLLVTWLREGEMVALPTHSSREHAGKYTVQTGGHGQKNFKMEVQFLAGSCRNCKKL